MRIGVNQNNLPDCIDAKNPDAVFIFGMNREVLEVLAEKQFYMGD